LHEGICFQKIHSHYGAPKQIDVIEMLYMLNMTPFHNIEKGWPELEAQKFYNHYQSIGWKIGGKIKIENWHACAKNWILKSEELKTEKQVSHFKDKSNFPTEGKTKGGSNLHTFRNKDYNQPL